MPPLIPPRPTVPNDPEMRRFVSLLHEMMRVLIAAGLIERDGPNSWTIPSAAVADEALEAAEAAQEEAEAAREVADVKSDDIDRRFAVLVFHYGTLLGVPPGLEEDFNAGARESQV